MPFVSKATGVPWAKLGHQVMVGKTLDEILAESRHDRRPAPEHISVKEAVFPFTKFPGVDVSPRPGDALAPAR